jgi:hypothetical protein
MAACLLRVEGGSDAPVIQLEQLELDLRETRGDRAQRFLGACGVDPSEIDNVMRSAHIAARRTGKVLVELQIGEGAPGVSLREDNVAFLPTSPREMASAR